MSNSGMSRRGFIGKMGQGLLAANVTGVLLKDAPAQLRVPDPPGKKLGWAVVGLAAWPSIRFCRRLPSVRRRKSSLW